MRKFVKVITLIVLLVSFLMSIKCVSRIIQVHNWVKKEAVITFIGLPMGVVFGNYWDEDGVLHEEEALYSDLRFLRSSVNVHNTMERK